MASHDQEHVDNLISAALQTYAFGEKRSAEGEAHIAAEQFKGAARMLFEAIKELVPAITGEIEDHLPSVHICRDTSVTPAIESVHEQFD